MLDSFYSLIAPPPAPPPPSLLAEFYSSWVLLIAATIAVAALILCSRRCLPHLFAVRRKAETAPALPIASDEETLTVFYASQKGHSRRFAERLVAHARRHGIAAVATDLSIADPDRLVEYARAVFIVATYTGGSAVPGTEPFFDELTEMSRDFRVEKTLLAGTSFAVFGCGNSEYPAKDFNAIARRLDRAMRLLGAKRLLPRREGDDIDNALSEQFDSWLGDFLTVYDETFRGCLQLEVGGGAKDDVASASNGHGDVKGRTPAQARRIDRLRKQGEADAAKAAKEAEARRAAAEGGECCGGKGEGEECCGGGGQAARAAPAATAEAYPVADDDSTVAPLPVESDDEDSVHGSDGGYGSDGGGVLDVEDLGSKLVARDGATAAVEAVPGEVRQTSKWAKTEGVVDEANRKPMVTPSLRQSLTKQGYKIVGSHSGVKLCRWTKAMLRGRGGCYKHTFYGIVSYQCMEATPSLACANKCVFCWRHHDNPVGTSFRWQVDPPKMLVDGFEDQHKQMIKAMRGVPGVKPERFEQASKHIRHCALSLVGEPIIYPEINALLDQLHSRGISSFMVTNAQFPDQMETLKPTTQLYISVDAPTPTELKAVDRPLFPDFWERFLACVDMLHQKRQRTVFRLTLVNGWNTEQLDKYVELVGRGKPDFVEVKGVTYCGDSTASPLTIKHCPYHAEVRAYCQEMAKALGGDYELASEHAHSNIVLIARTKFKIDGAWHTWIDYDKFTALYNSGEPFSSLDYCAPTPQWAVYDENAADGGFDPDETRFVRKGGAQAVTGGGC